MIVDLAEASTRSKPGRTPRPSLPRPRSRWRTRLLRLFGSGFEADTGRGFQAVGFAALSAPTGVLRGTLDSGNAFEFSFLQGGSDFTGRILLVPEASSALLLLAGARARPARTGRRAGSPAARARSAA